MSDCIYLEIAAIYGEIKFLTVEGKVITQEKYNTPVSFEGH